MKIVLVEWIDSYNYPGWQDITPPDVAKCISTGFQVGENDEAIRICLDINKSNGHIGESMSIPKCAIKRIRRLRVK